MPVDLLLEGSSTSDLVIAVSPAAELQSCLHALAEPEHHLELHAWIARTRRSLSEPLSRDLTRFAPLWARRRCRFLMPFAVPADASLSTEFARVQELPADRFLVAAAHTIHGGSIDPLAVVDQPDRFVHECESRSFSRGELARELVRDAAAFKASLIDVLRRCEREFFDDEWARIAGRLRDDASTMRKVAARVPLAEAIASVSPVATVRRGGASVRFDKLQMLEVPTAGRRIVLVPSLHGTPHVVVRGDTGFPVVVQYPVARATASPLSVSVARRRLAVLADDARLALCRHLVNEAITTSDLALRTGMSAPQVSRHLSRLRDAELLTTERSGRQSFHRLDTQKLMQLGPELLRALVR